MKGFSKLKTIQMIIFLIAAILSLVIIVRDGDLYQMIGFNGHIKALCVLLWVMFGLSFLFMYLDFRLDSSLRRENEELNYAFYTDPDTGIANRNSCDVFIDQYRDRLLPEGMAAITLVLTNLKELNDEFGYEVGDQAINDMVQILQDVLPKGDFLGRNGGDKFLLIMKKCSRTDRDKILAGIDSAVKDRNRAADAQHELRYRTGAALQMERHAKTLTTLVAASDRRAHEEN